MTIFVQTMTDKAIQRIIKLSRKAFTKRMLTLRGKLTQEDFALECGIDPRTLQNIEAGKEPRFSTLVRIATGLKMTLEELMKGVK